jgi:hypothetical protein
MRYKDRPDLALPDWIKFSYDKQGYSRISDIPVFFMQVRRLRKANLFR